MTEEIRVPVVRRGERRQPSPALRRAAARALVEINKKLGEPSDERTLRLADLPPAS